MNAREWKLVVATGLLSATGLIAFWRHNSPVPEPLRKPPADNTRTFDTQIPRIGKMIVREELIVRDEKVDTAGDVEKVARNENPEPAPVVPAITETPVTIAEPLPVQLPEKLGTLPLPIALPSRLPPTPRQPDRPPGAPLTYIGFAVDDAGRITAFVETSNVSPAARHNVREGDFLLGRFQVTHITQAAIEVEDTEGTEAERKQTFLLKK